MLFEEVIRYFKSFQTLAHIMNRDTQTFYYWKRANMVPYKAQVFLEVYTKGALKADKAHAKSRTVTEPYKTRKDKGISKGPRKQRDVPTEIIDTNLQSMAQAIGKVISA